MISRPVHGVIPKSMERTGKKMKEMNAANVSEMMNYVADQMIGKKDLLCEIDGKTGDGDHGMGIAGIYGGEEVPGRRAAADNP